MLMEVYSILTTTYNVFILYFRQALPFNCTHFMILYREEQSVPPHLFMQASQLHSILTVECYRVYHSGTGQVI